MNSLRSSPLLLTRFTASVLLLGAFFSMVKDKVQFGASGNVKLSDYKAEGGKVSGKVTTDGEQQFFKDTWQIDVTFSVAGP